MELIRLLLLLNTIALSMCAKEYCKRSDPCWPSQSQWNELGNSLNGSVHPLDKDDYGVCQKQGDNAFNISAIANGICMQYHDCSRQFCIKDNPWNIPAYSVEVLNVEDVQKAVVFANKHNMSVTVKTSGHNYAGASMGKDSLLIWMHNFEAYLKTSSDVKPSLTDSCGTKYKHNVKVGGGQDWNSVYRALGSDYHIVGGGGLTVAAAGGWLQGCGLSAMSRKYGIGIDNVLNFEIVLANGSHVFADACTNPDLFWALRGGGGGTWGVVTSVHYKLHLAEPVLEFYMEIKDITLTTETVDSWLAKWVQLSPNLDRRWGGYWTLNSLILYFVGSEQDARTTFINKFDEWKNSLPKENQRDSVFVNIKKGKSYFDVRGGEDITTDKTGQQSINIASRLVPREFLVNNPAKAVDTLKWLVRNGFSTFNYLLGEAVTNPVANATAVHPAMRKAAWQISTITDKMTDYLRREIKDTAPGFNHASHLEPDWRNAFWGPNLQRLQGLKKQYDPDHRFNCWHCVGYQGNEPSSSGNRALQSFTAAIALLALVSAFFCL